MNANDKLTKRIEDLKRNRDDEIYVGKSIPELYELSVLEDIRDLLQRNAKRSTVSYILFAIIAIIYLIIMVL